MLKSMTGFGRSEIVNVERKLIVEMKAVNHR
ncbi:MAG: YicC/YloC family endoribonuclease, partial [Acetivibrio ethanolgignens]